VYTCRELHVLDTVRTFNNARVSVLSPFTVPHCGGAAEVDNGASTQHMSGHLGLRQLDDSPHPTYSTLYAEVRQPNQKTACGSVSSAVSLARLPHCLIQVFQYRKGKVVPVTGRGGP
jgi:hypothetical protein